MDRKQQANKAEAFRALHFRDAPLVLPNIWDAGSAVMAADAGFPALATTSAGVAWALGYGDGEKLHRDQMLEAVARIANRVALPVTADMEAGYGAGPDGLLEFFLPIMILGGLISVFKFGATNRKTHRQN